MHLVIANQEQMDSVWERYTSTEYHKDIIAVEQNEQNQIEELIQKLIGEDYSLRFDWVVDHFTTPRYIFTITLQNSELFQQSIIEEIFRIVTGFNDRWKLNLGLVDAIHDETWDSTDDIATFFVTQDGGWLFKDTHYHKLNSSVQTWLDTLVRARH